MENNRAILHEWLQLYIDNIHNLTVKPSKLWERVEGDDL